jgi:hypothetical protein
MAVPLVLALSNTTVPTDNVVENTAAKTYIGDGLEMSAATLMVGDTYLILGQGYFSSKATSPGTIRITVESNTVILGDTATFDLPSGLLNTGFVLVGVVKCISTGATGKLQFQGEFIFQTHYGIGCYQKLINTGTLLTGHITVDTTTGANILGVAVQFSLADASNTITFTQLTIAKATTKA